MEELSEAEPGCYAGNESHNNRFRADGEGEGERNDEGRDRDDEESRKYPEKEEPMTPKAMAFVFACSLCLWLLVMQAASILGFETFANLLWTFIVFVMGSLVVIGSVFAAHSLSPGFRELVDKLRISDGWWPVLQHAVQLYLSLDLYLLLSHFADPSLECPPFLWYLSAATIAASPLTTWLYQWGARSDPGTWSLQTAAGLYAEHRAHPLAQELLRKLGQ